MTNADKYKTAQERAEAYAEFLNAKGASIALQDSFAWLDLEAEDEKPLPCPCCGADAEIHYEDDVEREGDASVQCKGCFLMTPDYPSDVEAVMAWNKRMSNQERK